MKFSTPVPFYGRYLDRVIMTTAGGLLTGNMNEPLLTPRSQSFTSLITGLRFLISMCASQPEKESAYVSRILESQPKLFFSSSLSCPSSLSLVSALLPAVVCISLKELLSIETKPPFIN